ncbi:hypothetical protein PENSTE_c026G02339 [Penicillium steckii]|uniref:PPPDE domain-containing protein n=1 Tax=Penicillium steckii TaxID=303698 RepID=A0A1V6SPD7_9EURO|nr:hypothetical protein PENSTE_c026G02339 [Penicillium steckii]
MVSAQDVVNAKIAGSVLGVCAAVFILIRTIISIDRKRAAEASLKKAAGYTKTVRIPSNEIFKRYKEALDKIVTARLKKESTTSSGEPIFLSHYISRGQFRHWVMHVHNHKYELRQRAADESNPKPYFVAAVSPSDFNFEKYRQSIALHYAPEVGNYFYSLIGWTKYSKERVDKKCHQMFKDFGKYSLFTNNCHDFLQSLAGDIVTTKAPDWDWLIRYDGSGYHYMRKPKIGYNAIICATWSKQLSEEKHHLGAEERQEIDQFIIFLEERVQEFLSDASQKLSLISISNANSDAVFFSNGTMQFDSSGYHYAGVSHDGVSHDGGAAVVSVGHVGAIHYGAVGGGGC